MNLKSIAVSQSALTCQAGQVLDGVYENARQLSSTRYLADWKRAALGTALTHNDPSSGLMGRKQYLNLFPAAYMGIDHHGWVLANMHPACHALWGVGRK